MLASLILLDNIIVFVQVLHSFLPAFPEIHLQVLAKLIMEV